MGQERSFLDQLVGLLQQVKAGNTGAIEAELSASGQDDVVNVAIYAALAERERELRAAGEWDRTRRSDLATRAGQWERDNGDGSNTRRVLETAQVLSKFNRRTLLENVKAIAAAYAPGDAGLAVRDDGLATNIEQRIVSRCVIDLLHSKTRLHAVGTYAVEVGAIVQSTPTAELTPLGEDLLQLRGRDFVRMLLANEVARSTGDLDDWRISALVARRVLREKSVSLNNRHWPRKHPISFRSLDRLCEFGVCSHSVDEDEDGVCGETFTLTEEGADALADTVARGPTPFTLRATALLRDSNERLLPESARRGTNTAQLVEHAQMVAHELGNKLSAMSQRIEMLRAKASAEGTGDAVSADIDRVQRIIENIQAFADDQARIAGAADARAALFDVATAMREITARLKAELNGALEVDLPESLPAVRGMKEQLAVVIDELVRNARRAITSSAARIKVRAAQRERGWIEIHVEDNGPGVAEAERARIFDRGVSERSGGGQGLALVRRIVTLHFRGVIECAQSPLGGADFLLLVPTDKQEER